VLINNELAGQIFAHEDSPIAIVMLGKPAAASQKREESRMQKSLLRGIDRGQTFHASKLGLDRSQ